MYLVFKYDLKKCSHGFDFHYRILLYISIIIVGLSYRLGMDTVGYMTYFENVNADIYYTFTHLTECRYEPIPELVFSVCKYIWNDFTLVQFVISIFVNVTIFWFLKKHSPMLFFSIFLYFIFQYWNLNFEVKRESIAISIFLIAIDRILKDDTKLKDYLWYYGICSIAFLAHRFAFITFFYPLCQNLKFSKLYITFILLLLIILTLDEAFIRNTLSSINSLLALSSKESIQYYLNNTRYGSGGISLLGTINKILIPLFIVYNASTVTNKKIYSFALFYFIVVLFQSQVFIFYRITNYLFIFVFIVYAYMLKRILLKEVNNKIIVYLLCFSIMFHFYTLTKKDQYIRYLPYCSIINKELNQERELTYRDIDLMLNY